MRGTRVSRLLNPPLVRIAFWLAAAFAVTMALLPHPPHVPLDRFGDKVEHIVAFAVLTLLAQFGFARTRRWLVAERLSFLGAVIEVLQSIPALHRDCDIRDWLVDTLAIVVVTLVVARGRRRIAAKAQY